ncbi:glycosyltransferase [Pseudonocardia bannensis]|uniref:Glycosyltransferase family 1 protein n=1 Tax=Pseudonocardia bannensis TaxID=630973 RepID=A0A848DBT5_9PSEU|nr:glycosyltransferase [Pseudonocardia bannensis]NMH90018.1 glycosyltransferase family 1 protein [Pseudonocardia bannensis]
MRIAMVSEHASPLAAPGGPDSGGQNVHVRELSRALAAAGHDVTVWTRRDDSTTPAEVVTAPGIRVRHITAGPATRLPKDELVPHVPELARGLLRAWAADRPDVVHAHFWMSGLASLAAAGRLGIPLVQTFHALGHVKRRHQGAEDTSPEGRTAAERAIARQVDRVIATCTDEVFELFRLGAARPRITVVPCGVDTETFTPQGPVLERGYRRRLVSIGRLVRRKGVDEVIEALSRVPAAELLVAGGPPAGEAMADDPDVRRLQALARARGVAGRVRFLGAVARPDVPALLRSADAVVCVPWYEPFGMVPLEAMACGRPVVASAVGGMTDTVIHQVTGLHVPPRRPDALARSLCELLAQPTLQLTLGAAGRDRAVARYGWDRVGAATAEVYEQVIAARAERSERLARVGR